MEINRKKGWLDFLIYTYDGLSMVYEELGEPDSALHYFRQYHFLQDSLIGGSAQSRINRLEEENEDQKQELALLRQKEIVQQQRRQKLNILLGAIGVSLLLGGALWWVQSRRRRIQQQLLEKRGHLLQLTKILGSKNAELRDLKMEFERTEKAMKHADRPHEMVIDPFNIKILTPEDWQAFKSLFERSFPAYIQSVRSVYPDITEAEERLFLLIKLKLNTREAADMLGVQLESVKKTRNRLRKRLKLKKGVSLESFVARFPENEQKTEAESAPAGPSKGALHRQHDSPS
jgi:DNA-binding CsgD family transcriptional regulator